MAEYSQCIREEALTRLKEFYANNAKHGKSHGKASGGYVSGGTAATGGVVALSEYVDSTYSSAKEELIRKIAKDMNDILGIKGTRKFNVDGDINTIVEQMNEILPNPRKRRGLKSNKAGESKYTAIHKELCRGLAESINKNYGSGVVDLEQSDGALCNSVAEVIHSLISGMHSEFSTVAADVSQVIRNLTIMMEYLKRSHEKLKSVIAASGNSTIQSQADVVDKFYEKLVVETNRQLAILNNLMGGVISPVGNDFLQVLRETDDFKGFVEDIKGSLGSAEFGNKLGYLLAGVNNMAQTAKIVDKALKDVGMSVKQYKQTSGIENLRDEIYGLLAKTDKLTADGLIKFMKAAQVLYTNDMQHPQIIEYLEKTNVKGGDCSSCGASGGGCGCNQVDGGYSYGGYRGGVAGGEDLEYTAAFERKESYSANKYESQNKIRKLIFDDFEKQLLTLYQRIIGVVQQIGPKLGTEIPVSDELMKFVRAFNNVEGANRTSIASALSGYNKSGIAKDVRNNFLSSLEVVDITLDPLIAKSGLFRELRNEINILMKLVEQFSTKFVDAISTPPSFNATGGEVGGIIVNHEPPVGMAERYASFGRAQFQLHYFSRIASIKRSMARAATEKKSVGEDYVRMVGQATARLINEQATEFKKAMESLNYWDKEPNTWTDAKDFESKLPKGSPGRALYFYMQTVSGFEPTATQNDIPHYFRGNIKGNGANTTGVPALLLNASTAVWHNPGAAGIITVAGGGANVNLPDAFADLWDFRDEAGARHTPVLVQMAGAGANNTIFVTASFIEYYAKGSTVEDFKLTTGGANANLALPRAYDRNFKDSLMSKRYSNATKLVEVIKDLENKAFNAKKDLVEVAENIDLYLSSFTDSMLAKPESLLSLAKILQRFSVVRKMYTDASGDNLAKVFEMFPAAIMNVDANNTLHYPMITGTSGSRRPGQAVIDASALNLGDAKSYDTKSGHYYNYVSSVCGTASLVGNHRLAFDLSTIFEGKDKDVEALVKNIEKSVLGVRALENILLAFVQLGNEQTSQTFMTHGKVLKSLFNYVTVSAISRRHTGDTVVNNPLVPNPANGPVNLPTFDIANSPFAGNNVHEYIVSLDPAGPLKLALTISLNQIEAYAASSYKDDFKTTDHIMEMVLKAICSKVLTVLGLYQIYNKPTSDYLSFGAIRTIMGGAPVDRPKVNPEAIDLYVRLPLLAEWFRDMLVGKSDNSSRHYISSNNYMIALIPDVTNLWGEFLKTIFIKSDMVEEGNYSEEDTNVLITEINKIYNSFKAKSSADTVLAACEGLVSEVNLRYSIVKKNDVDNYWENMKGKRFEPEDFDGRKDDDYVDFDLLDSHNGVKLKAAPSDRFMDVNLITAAKDSNWSKETFTVVKNLHARMFNSFNRSYKDAMGELKDSEKFINEGKFSILKYSFDGVIRQYKDEIKVATNEEERYKIACKAIQDVGRMSDVNPDKVVMLHEFVIAPLTSLMSTYNMLRNVIESFIWMSKESLVPLLTYLNTIHAVQFATIGVNDGVATNTELCTNGTQNISASPLYNDVLRTALEYFHPAASPFLHGLFTHFEEFAEHGINPAATVVFGNDDVRNASKSYLLSTKKLFKTHMQLFANLKSSLGDKFNINFTNKSYPIVDFGGLISQCEGVLNNIKKALVYLRPTIPLEVIRKYEDATNIGSIYWLEENMFSNLFYNEQRTSSFVPKSIEMPAATAAGVLAFFTPAKFNDINATIPLLNQILKSSFSVVTERSASATLNGKSLCEKGLMELCAWGLSGREDRIEINNVSRTNFPFNVVDMIDDIDPAIGKVRKLLLEKQMQTAVAELTKKLATLQGPSVNTAEANVHSKVFKLLRILVAARGSDASRGMSGAPNSNMPVNQRDLDVSKDLLVPLPLNDFLDEDMKVLFLDETGGNGITKIGSPAFGLNMFPFQWDGTSIAVANNGYCVGVTAHAARAENDPSFTDTFNTLRTAVETLRIRALTARAGTILARNGLPIAVGNRINTISIIPSAPVFNDNVTVTTIANKFGRYVNDQITFLNSTFDTYLSALDLIDDVDVNTFLTNELTMPVAAAGAAIPLVGNSNVVRTNILEIRQAVSRIRFILGYHHLIAVTTPGAVGLNATGVAVAADINYIVNDSFTNAYNINIANVVNLLYNPDSGRDMTLNANILANVANHTTAANAINLDGNVISNVITNFDNNYVDNAPAAVPLNRYNFLKTRRGYEATRAAAGAPATLIDAGTTLCNFVVGLAQYLESLNPTPAAVTLADQVTRFDIGDAVGNAGAAPVDWGTEIALANARANGVVPTALEQLNQLNATAGAYAYLGYIISRGGDGPADAAITAALARLVIAPIIGVHQYMHTDLTRAAPAGLDATTSGLLLAAANPVTYASIETTVGQIAVANAMGVVIDAASMLSVVKGIAVCVESSIAYYFGGRPFVGAAIAVNVAVPLPGIAIPAEMKMIISTTIATLTGRCHAQDGATLRDITRLGFVGLHGGLTAPAAAVTATAIQGGVKSTFTGPYVNTECKIITIAHNSPDKLFLGFNYIINVRSLALPLLHPVLANDAAADLLAVRTGYYDNAITLLTTPQAQPLTADFNINVADLPSAEPWLRKLVYKHMGTKETTFWRNQINSFLKDFYSYDVNNAQNDRPNFNGMNVAFIVNRMNIYDQWSDKGIMSTEKADEEKSTFSSRGLLVQFNQLMAAYIGTFIEPGTKRFYGPLVENMVSSKISDAITSGNAIADINITGVASVGLPPEGAVLCASIARAIRVLLYKRQENSKDLMHSTNSLLEVAGFMRESMKANLPHFARMFNQLADVASTYKKIILDNVKILKFERVAPVPANAVLFTPASVTDSERMISKSQKPYINPNLASSESDCMRYYRVMLDNIELACVSATRCIGQVYKELNDVPLFGETYSGSLLEFKQKSGKYPLALPSVMQVLLHHNAYNNGIGLPAAKHGSDAFKMLFMTRRVLTETPNVKINGGNGSTLDYMPGFIETINNYNAINPEPSKIPKALIEASIKSNIDLINILIDLKVRGAWIFGPESNGGGLFRREIYGSSTQLDVNKSAANVGFNNLAHAAQVALRTTAPFLEYAKARGLSATNKNQSIYILKAGEKEFEMDVNGTKNKHKRAAFFMNTYGALAGAEIQVFNIVGAWPAIPAGLAAAGVRPVPSFDRQYLTAYSDTLKHPTSLCSYAFSSAEALSNLITLVESTDIHYNKQHLLELFTNLSSGYDSRSKSRFYNILDLNIVPINIHALQSKVPLINLLNYSFTFDKFVLERLKIDRSGGAEPTDAQMNEIFPEDNAAVTDVKSAFARMLIHPYASVSPNQFNTWHSRVAVGATGGDIPMDRPRYFSDQIYNKVCLQSLNPAEFMNPGGPGYVMENQRFGDARRGLAAVIAARFENITAATIGHAVGNAAADLPQGVNQMVNSTLTGMLGAAAAPANSFSNVAGLVGAAPALVAPLGNALDIAYIDTVAPAMKAWVETLANPGGVDSETYTLIKNTVKEAIDAHVKFVRDDLTNATAAAAGVRSSPNGYVRYDMAGNAATAPLQNEAFTDTAITRTMLIYLADKFINRIDRTPIAQRVDSLFYITDNEEVKRVDLANNGNVVVNVQGKLRYDTKLVRSLSWFSHLHRFLLWSIKDSLVKSSQPVVDNLNTIDSSMVDFRGYQSYQKNEYHL